MNMKHPDASILQIFKTIADARNGTIVFQSPLESELSQVHYASTVGPGKYSFKGVLYLHLKTASVYPTDNTGFRLVYCKDVIKQVESIFLTSLLLKTADVATWISLLLALTCIAHVAGVRPTSFIKSCINLFHPLVSQPYSIFNRRASSILIIWLFGSCFFRIYFEAELTSLVTSPRQEVLLETFTDISKSRRQLIYFNRGTPALYSNLVSKQIVDLNKTLSKNELKGLQLFQTLLLKAGKSHFLGRDLVLNSSLAYISLSSFTRSVSVRAQTFLEQQFKDGPQTFKRRRCHMGKREILPTSIYYVFTGTESTQYLKTFNLIAESGIYFYWMNEFILMMPRIQDRNRFDANRNLQEMNAPVLPLAMEDRLRNVFMGWSVLTVVALIQFLYEVSMYKNIFVILKALDMKVRCLHQIRRFFTLVLQFSLKVSMAALGNTDNHYKITVISVK